jgi:hypothetical protein
VWISPKVHGSSFLLPIAVLRTNSRRLSTAARVVIDHAFDEPTDGIRILEAVLLAGARTLEDAGQPPERAARTTKVTPWHRLFVSCAHMEDSALPLSTRREGRP